MSTVCWFIIGALAQAAMWLPSPDFPPLPDFNTRIDYVAWYDQASSVDADEDGYALYAEFIPDMVGGTVSESEWAKFAGMLTAGAEDGSKKTAAPVPWDPAKHAPWEASCKRTAKALKKFAAASKKRNCVTPSGLSRGKDDAGNLLRRIRFAHLPYLKQCAAGTLEAAWRMEEGKVSSKKMLAAIGTNLRVARQLDRSLFAIEASAAYEIRKLTCEHVAWALAHKVFAGQDLKKLGAVLDAADDEPVEFSRTARGEAASLLDTLQFIFGPLSPGGSLALNGNRLRDATGQTLGADKLSLGARLEVDAPGTAKAILDAYSKAGKLIGPTFKDSRLRELRSTMEQMERFNKITALLCFNVSGGATRTYTLDVRSEMHRRGTRVLAELFAYQAAKGQWPKKLSMLDKTLVKKIGDDPFGDGLFRYKLTKDGPKLYSVFENGEDDRGEPADEGGPGQSGDYVFWPIPGGERAVAAGGLVQKQDQDLTPLSAIGPALEGKTVTVAAKVTEVSSEPDPKRGRIYTVTLTQDGKTAELFYDGSIAKSLTQQEIKPGKTIRATGVVVKSGEGYRIELKDPKKLVVEG